MRIIKELKENMAVAVGKDLTISTKDSIELSNFIRGRYTTRVKKILDEIIELEIPIPYKRFTGDRGHKSGMAAGRFPVNVAKILLKLVKSAEANASVKGLNTSSLIIKSIIPNRAARSYHYGRRRGLKTKGTHIELILEEVLKTKETKSKQKTDNNKTEIKKETTQPKKELKTETKKEEPKKGKKVEENAEKNEEIKEKPAKKEKVEDKE